MELFKKTLEDVKKLPESKRERAQSVASKVIFMHDQLEELQKRIKENGWTETYTNGPNQVGIKKSTDGEVYNSLIKNYNSAMKQLNEMLSNVPDVTDSIEAKYF